jgi:hypothetical protein
MSPPFFYRENGRENEVEGKLRGENEEEGEVGLAKKRDKGQEEREKEEVVEEEEEAERRRVSYLRSLEEKERFLESYMVEKRKHTPI